MAKIGIPIAWTITISLGPPRQFPDGGRRTLLWELASRPLRSPVAIGSQLGSQRRLSSESPAGVRLGGLFAWTRKAAARWLEMAPQGSPVQRATVPFWFGGSYWLRNGTVCESGQLLKGKSGVRVEIVTMLRLNDTEQGVCLSCARGNSPALRLRAAWRGFVFR